MPKFHEFKIRVSPDLWAIIENSRGENSLNGQINKWLWAMADPDAATKLANALRPLLISLNADDQAAFTAHMIAALKLLAKGEPKRKPRKARKPQETVSDRA